MMLGAIGIGIVVIRAGIRDISWNGIKEEVKEKNMMVGFRLGVSIT